MDWYTLLLLFVFFILPLFQKLLERGRQKDTELPPDGNWEQEYPPPPLPESRQADAQQPAGATAAKGDGWSSGWGDWPGQTETLEQLPPPPTEEVPPVMHVPVRTREIVVAERPVPVRLPSVPEGQIARPEWATTEPIRPRKVAAHVPRRTTAMHGLRRPGQLRQAIILKEILGPPIALRGSEGHRLPEA
jgi:hypothetical protein